MIEWVVEGGLLCGDDGLQVSLDELGADLLRAELLLLERFTAALEEAHVLVGCVYGPKPEVASILFFVELAAVVGGELSFFLERGREELWLEKSFNESGQLLSSGAVTWSFNRFCLMIDLILDVAAFNKVVCFLVHSMKIRVIIIMMLILHYEEARTEQLNGCDIFMGSVMDSGRDYLQEAKEASWEIKFFLLSHPVTDNIKLLIFCL